MSWSGGRSKATAELLSEWTKCVLQASRPWISTRDIDRGALWFSEISDQLKDTTVGIVCLTQENKNRPWILFEAGALAKGLSSNRVCTFLVDLKPADLEDPLAQFNHTLPDRESLWELVRTLNGCLGASILDERILETVFATYWPQFETRFKELLKEVPPVAKAEQRSEKNLLGEILENTRALTQRMRSLESRVERDVQRDGVPVHSSFSSSGTKMTMARMRAQGMQDAEILREFRHSPMSQAHLRLLLAESATNEDSTDASAT
jgi:hypothetical protein